MKDESGVAFRHIWPVGALAALLLAAPVQAADRAPVAGKWKGNETHWWDGGRWLPYTSSERENYRLVFQIKNKRVLTFKAARYTYTCSATGEKISIRPTFKRARIRKRGGAYRFHGKTKTTVSGRQYTAELKGTFASSRRVLGTLKSTLSGCGNSDQTKWKASKPKPKPKPPPDRNGAPPGCVPYIWTDPSGWPHLLYRC